MSGVAFSFAAHAVLLALLVAVAPSGRGVNAPEWVTDDTTLAADAPPDEGPRAKFDSTEIDPSAFNPAAETGNPSDVKAEVNVPGVDNPAAVVGTADGSALAPPRSVPPPAGFGPPGTGGSPSIPDGAPGGKDGTPGGFRPADSYRVRGELGSSAAARLQFAEIMGGTAESEAAVARGLQWLARQQSPDGRWSLDGAFPDKGGANDTAATALALLPFVGAGKTHKRPDKLLHDKVIEKGLRFLARRQDKRTGDLGGGMYGHGLATLVLCEAYGLTQDPWLRRPAEKAVGYIVSSQHDGGGWRYSPGQPGDLSVTGWQVMALKSAQMAGLDVPPVTLKKAARFLDSVNNRENEGYGYVTDAATPTMSAVGLLCRQYLHAWGPQNPRFIKGIGANLKPVPPGAKKDTYYYYYATQVMYHFGGEGWKSWNDRMRELLTKSQEASPQSPLFGSWSSAGDLWGNQGGGRLMVTSLNLLTLEVYYRYLPLYHRDLAARKDGVASMTP